MLDVAQMFSESWTMVMELTICRYWVKSGMYPTLISTDVNETYGRMTNVSKQNKMLFLVKFFRNIRLKVEWRDLLSSYYMKNVGYAELERWSGIGADVEVQCALVEDSLNDMLSSDTGTSFGDGDGADASTQN